MTAAQKDKNRPHPWRAWNPGSFAVKSPEPMKQHHFPKGLTKTNRAR